MLTNGTGQGQGTVSFVPGEAVLLTISNVPNQTVKQGLIGGELHLAWTGSPVKTVIRVPRVPVRTPPEAAEEIILSAINKMTPAQRLVYSANARKPTRIPRPVLNVEVKVLPPSTIKRVETRHPTISAARDQTLIMQRNGAMDALTKAYGGSLPTPPK